MIYMAMLSHDVQLYISRVATKELEKITQSKIEIGNIYFKPFRTLELNNVYVSDFNNDTLFYVHKLNTSINWLELDGPSVYLDEVTIDSAKVYFSQDSSGTLNLNHFIESFGADTTEVDTSPGQFKLSINHIDIKKTSFRLKNYKPAQQTYGVNYEDMFFKNILIKAHDFELINAFIDLKIDHSSFREQSGLVIDTLNGHYKMDSAGIRLLDYNLRIDSTFIRAKYQKLVFSDFEEMGDFLNNVDIDADITNAHIKTQDIAWFVPDFKSMDLKANVQGKISGPVSRLKGEDFKVSITDSTYLFASFSLNGLPDIENTFLYAKIHNLTGYREDLKNIPLLLDDDKEPPLPPEITRFGYTGIIRGFFNDLVSNGTIKTNVGNLKTNVAYKQEDNNDIKLNGAVSSYYIAVDQFTGEEQMLGKTALTSKFEGIFKPGGNFNFNLESSIKYFDFNQYRINNIEIQGQLTQEAFDGDIQINDSALKTNFTGHFEYGAEKPVQRFLMNIEHADLAALNFDSDSLSQLSCDIIANVKGMEPDKISGKINILDLDFNRGERNMKINELVIKSDQETYKKNHSIRSDFLNIDLTGRYKLTELSPAISELVSQYAPQIRWDTSSMVAPETEFKLNINMLNIQPLVDLFIPDISISNNTNFTASYNKTENLMLIEGESEKVEVAGMKLNHLSVRAFNAPNRIHTTITSKKFNYAGDFALANLKLNTTLQPDSIDLNINWDNSQINDTVLYSGNINSNIELNTKDSLNFEKFSINLDPSYIVIADTLWNISKSKITVDSTSYTFKNFIIENRFQYLKLNGAVSENDADTLWMNASNVNISPLNLFTEGTGLYLEGILDADMKVSQVYSNPFVGSKINLSKLTINDQLIGDTEISTEWDPFLEMIHLEWLSTIQETEVLNIMGDYDPANSRMNFRLFIDRFNLSILEPYMEGILHDLKGLTTAEVILKGTIEEPELRGVVIFDRTAFTLDYTQTRYEITDWFDIAPDAIYFNNLRITDKFNHFGHLNGKITHENFENIAVDLEFNSRNLMFLNTRREDNDQFFGTVFASGKTNLVGSLNDLEVDVSVKTDKNTKFFIPLESSEEVSKYDFIKFKYIDTTINQRFLTSTEETQKEEKAEDAISVNMNLNITPEAEVQIIFDSKIGDIIKSRGSADMNINMDKSGDLTIYGDYIIEEGDYLFTLQDVFQKHLTIAKGSNLSWAGNPEEAVVDIDAIYRVRRASVYDLTFNPEHQELVVPVETHLLMTGGLESPRISFNLDLPTGVEDIQEQLNNLPQEDMNKQVLSLLVMNRFLPLPGAQTANKNEEDFGMESNASELLSNQVSNWLSQISSSFDIGFNYTPSDEVESQEYEVAVSTQLLNNRVTIQSNVGVGGEQVSSTSETENTSNIAGDFQVDVKLNRSGKLRLKAYARSNDELYTEAETKQGLGVFYKEEFNTFGELWRRIFGGDKETKQDTTKSK